LCKKCFGKQIVKMYSFWITYGCIYSVNKTAKAKLMLNTEFCKDSFMIRVVETSVNSICLLSA